MPSAYFRALRSLLLTPVTALLIPSVETIGGAATNIIAGALALVGYLCVSRGRFRSWTDEGHSLVWLTIRYGKEMRAYADVGYPAFDAQAPSVDDTTAEN